jgi:hypothetical protein
MSKAGINRDIYSFASGLVLATVSWAVVPVVSDSFEPFDSELGFYLGQSFLSVAAFLIGCFFSGKHVLIYLLGAYISNNLYPYVFGSSESRTWAALGLATTLLLCIYPALSGMLGIIVRKICSRFRRGSTGAR